MLSRMELSAKNGDPVTGTPTGIQGIDEATTGGQPGDLIVIGARPSMGKTAFSQTIAYHTLKNSSRLLCSITAWKCRQIRFYNVF